MADEWHYARNGEQFGPVSGEELRRMAIAGELQPTDQIWKDGMPKWATANKLKGLSFPDSATKNTGSGPPPLEQRGEKTPSINETLKAAGSLAANQAKKTQITSVSLPVTFQKLGKYVFDQRLGLDLFKVEFDELDAQAAKLREFDRDPKSDASVPKNSLSESAKALAQSAADAAKKKMASVRFDQSLTRLGKRAYEERGRVELPQPAIDKISQLYDQVNSIDEIIQTTTVPNPGWSVFENRFVHSVLGVVFFPVGLFLIWRSDLWSKQAKLIWTGAVAFFFTVGALAPRTERPRNSNTETSEFTAEQLEVIESDPNLRVVHEMGHLNKANFERHLETVAEYKRKGVPIEGTSEYVFFLLMVPGKDWLEAAKARGMSREDLFHASNYIFKTAIGEDYDSTDKDQHKETFHKITGQSFDDY